MSVQNDARSLCELAAVLRDDHHKISVSTMGSHQILLNRIFSVHMGRGPPLMRENRNYWPKNANLALARGVGVGAGG